MFYRKGDITRESRYIYAKYTISVKDSLKETGLGVVADGQMAVAYRVVPGASRIHMKYRIIEHSRVGLRHCLTVPMASDH